MYSTLSSGIQTDLTNSCVMYNTVLLAFGNVMLGWNDIKFGSFIEWTSTYNIMNDLIEWIRIPEMIPKKIECTITLIYFNRFKHELQVEEWKSLFRVFGRLNTLFLFFYHFLSSLYRKSSWNLSIWLLFPFSFNL